MSNPVFWKKKKKKKKKIGKYFNMMSAENFTPSVNHYYANHVNLVGIKWEKKRILLELGLPVGTKVLAEDVFKTLHAG